MENGWKERKDPAQKGLNSRKFFDKYQKPLPSPIPAPKVVNVQK